MSAKRVEILESVQADLESARSFYESWKPGGGDEILRKYFDALDWIEGILVSPKQLHFPSSVAPVSPCPASLSEFLSS